jgi:PAS domain S-box-containing protein
MPFVAWRGLSDGYRKTTEGHSPWRKDDPHPKPVCIPDVAVADLDRALKSVVTAEGIGALAFIPLVNDRRLAGKFMVYYNAPHVFGDEELELSLTIAGQLALGIERMRAEQALRVVSLLPAQNPAPVLRITRAGTLLYANPAALESFKEWDLRIDTAVPRALNEVIAEAWSAGEVRTQEQIVGDRDYLVCIAPVLESDYANLYWNDITERKRSEVALRESEARFRQLADAMPQIVWTARSDGHIDYYNERWYEFTGFPRAEFGQSSWKPILHPDDVQRCVETYFGCIHEGKPYQIEYRFKDRASGGYRWFMGRAVPIRDDRGEILKWFGTCTDIDDQKRGNERLEKTVADRTQELQQANAAILRDMEERRKLEEQLLQAQKMESIGVLAGGIAHDFNNILNIIQGYASVLSGEGVESKQMDESLAIISETVQRGAILVQQLLTLARKSSIHLESVSLNGLIEGLISLISQTFPKTIELNSRLEADLPPILADSNQIEQALLNLCVNASDAMPDGGNLTFETKSVDGRSLQGLGDVLEPRYVYIEVSDTGKGIEESARERIFEPFFTTKKSQGTGLGLSVVYGIVKNHNGLIDVKSRPMSGTAFRLYFPISDSEKTADEPIVKPDIDPAPVSGAATVLVVEDEKNMLSLLEKVLLQQGYQVFTATDGEKALEIYQHHNGTIDVVLLDIGLPKLAGEDVLRKMKQQNPGVKVVIASGYLEPELKAKMDQAGVQYFLPKPYLPDKVVKILQRAIEGKP